MSEEKKFGSGTIFAKKYTVLSFLKTGVVGEDIYLAQERENQRKVMIRLLPTEISADPVLVQRFIRAFKLTASLNHANILPAYATGCEYNKYYFITAHLEGQFLDEMIGADEVCNTEDTLRLGIAICNALGYAWEKARLVHRNLKPDTILINPEGFPIITDFGIAKTTTKKKLTVTGFTVGDPRFMSPEQVRADRDLDCRSDIYCLGLIMYKMLTGQPAFSGDSEVALMDAQLNCLHLPPSTLNRNISAELTAVLDKMLAKDREARYPDWQTLKTDLSALLEQRPLPSLSVSVSAKPEADKESGWVKKIFNW